MFEICLRVFFCFVLTMVYTTLWKSTTVLWLAALRFHSISIISALLCWVSFNGVCAAFNRNLSHQCTVHMLNWKCPVKPVTFALHLAFISPLLPVQKKKHSRHLWISISPLHLQYTHTHMLLIPAPMPAVTNKYTLVIKNVCLKKKSFPRLHLLDIYLALLGEKCSL